jgi:hypothetical protein
LQQRLAQAGNAAVPENAQAPGEKFLAAAIPLDMLVLEELDDRLGNSKATGFHVVKFFLSRVSRGAKPSPRPCQLLLGFVMSSEEGLIRDEFHIRLFHCFSPILVTFEAQM